MIIENTELKGLLTEEAVLLDEIADDKKRVSELTDEMREIQKRNELELKKTSELRKKYTRLAVPLILPTLKENEMFVDLELKDGEVQYEVVDLAVELGKKAQEMLDDAKVLAVQEATRQKQDWMNYIDETVTILSEDEVVELLSEYDFVKKQGKYTLVKKEDTK